jgi:ribonuclease R
MSPKKGTEKGPRKDQRNKRSPSKSKHSFGRDSSSVGGNLGKFQFKDRSGKVHGRAGSGPSGRDTQERAAPSRGSPLIRKESQDRPEPKSKFKRQGEGKKFGGRHDRQVESRRERPTDVRIKATVDKNHKGFGFLIFEDRTYEDAFVPPRDAERFFHGDRVEVRLNSRGEVQDIQVLGHRFRELVGRYSPHPTGSQMGGWVIYERKRAREEVFIPEPKAAGKKLAAGDWIKVRLEFQEKGQHTVTGVITEYYGPELPASADIGMVSAEYNLIEEHSEQAVKEAQAMRLEVPGRDLEGREDLRKVPFITIDGETARDFDDAVYVEREGSGFILWVAIADVSHYVQNGTALDQEARSRGTSVYFPERAFHMLPRALSENLCSLKPNEPRLSMVAKMVYDVHGKRSSTEVYEAVIESHRRATYNEIQAEWEKNGKDPKWEFKPHFELYQIIRKTRADRGSIDFDLPEAELKVEPTGEVISIKQRARVDAHRLIEEFMIGANEAVTEWMLKLGWPFVYRVHEEPAMQSLLKFQKLAATVGVVFNLEDGSSPKVMADLVRKLEGHPAQELLNTALLRSLKQAMYSSVHGTHYGLASEGYTHFTSPIRRYPDLVVHRLLRWALAVQKKKKPALKPQEREDLEKELAEICEHCSYRERIASDAERESIKLKQVRAMIPHVGSEFDAKVVGMMEMGLFAQIPDPYSEGLVNKDTMTDDIYEYNEERMTFMGRRTRRSFKMGDILKVKVLSADIDRRQIELGFVDAAKPPVGKISPIDRPPRR